MTKQIGPQKSKIVAQRRLGIYKAVFGAIYCKIITYDFSDFIDSI